MWVASDRDAMLDIPYVTIVSSNYSASPWGVRSLVVSKAVLATSREMLKAQDLLCILP